MDGFVIYTRRLNQWYRFINITFVHTFEGTFVVTKILNTPFSISLTRGRIRFWSVVTYLGSRMFFFPMAPSQA